MIMVLQDDSFGSVALVYSNNYLLLSAYYFQDTMLGVSGDIN